MFGRKLAHLALIALAASSSLAGALAASASPPSPGTPFLGLTCVGSTDAGGIDRALAAAASPLAGHGATFVAQGEGAGIDPRALVAIAAHETLLETYVPAQAIHNPFGLGPGWAFANEAEAIGRAAAVLRTGYLDAGRVTLATIAPKWAPVGATNDPGGLNLGWLSGVAAYYRALGGDPNAPITLVAQGASSCSASSTASLTTTAWDGGAPLTAGPRMDQGGDPATGQPATLPGFTFPLSAAIVSYRDDFAEPGASDCYGGRWRCAVTLETVPGTQAVAAVAGRLVRASRDEQQEGIAFWIESGSDRVGYGALAGYDPGIVDGEAVTAGQPLGRTAGHLAFAWSREGFRIDPFPLLSATLHSS